MFCRLDEKAGINSLTFVEDLFVFAFAPQLFGEDEDDAFFRAFAFAYGFVTPLLYGLQDFPDQNFRGGCAGGYADFVFAFEPFALQVAGVVDHIGIDTALGGDFAQAYVIAHEVGHHVQNLVGTLEQINALKRRARSEAEQNALQVKVELQADCYAGVWAHYLAKAGRVLEAGDIDEALNAASAIGDDTLQRKFSGRVVPDSFTHGTSAQRKEWFKKGLAGGNLKACSFEP